MKKAIFLFSLIISIHTFSFSQNKNSKEPLIAYYEYHGSGFYALHKHTEKSLKNYVLLFEKEEKVNLNSIYAYPLTDDSYAYFFTLEELNERQKVKFISRRIEGMDSTEINSAITTLINAPKKISRYIDGIKTDKVNYINWRKTFD